MNTENRNTVVTIDKWFKIKNLKEENILTKFYEDPAKYSFSFQIMVLKTYINVYFSNDN